MRAVETLAARRADRPTQRALRACFARCVPRSWISSRCIASLPSAVAAILALLLSPNLLCGQSRPSEYSVKAAYLLNFGKFMRLSSGADSASSDFNICVVGEDPFGGSLDEITAGEKIDGRPVRVIRLERPDSRKCAIAYLGLSEQKRMEQDLAAFRDSDTLTVSDDPDFLKRGGMIQFLLQSDHVRFSVNLDPVRRTHLVLSSELLRVAASVSGSRQGEVQP